MDKLIDTAHPATTPVIAPTPSRRRPRRRLVGMVAALSALALVGAACSDDDTTETGAEADADAGGGGGGALAITIATPADGDEVGDSFDLEVESDTEFGESDTGLHHVHVYYDGRSDDTADYDLVYGNSFTVERDLEPGEHTVEAVIANADHSLTEASDEVTVTVGDDAGGGGGGGDTTTTTDSGADPYSY
ncbi:MAG: hypothetical protein ACRDZN_03560 [Acidimicrobiales bacterium]